MITQQEAFDAMNDRRIVFRTRKAELDRRSGTSTAQLSDGEWVPFADLDLTPPIKWGVTIEEAVAAIEAGKKFKHRDGSRLTPTQRPLLPGPLVRHRRFAGRGPHPERRGGGEVTALLVVVCTS